MKQKVIILGSNPMTRLSLIRSIGEAMDCDITVVNMVHSLSGKRRKPIDCYSKYVCRCLYARKYQAEALCNLLLKECADKTAKPILLSVDDDSANLVDLSLDRLKEHFLCANVRGEQGQLSRLMNKQLQKELAARFGFNVVKSWVIEKRNGAYCVPNDVTFPCYLKGLESFHTMKARQGRFDSRTKLEEALHQISLQYSFPMMAEEFIDIEKDLGVIGFCDGSSCVAPAIVELLDSGRGSHKGVSAFGLVRKEAIDEDIIRRVTGLVSSIGLSGLFNMDLAVSRGKVYFIELNLRFAAYGYAVTRSGVNLPAMFVNRILSSPDNHVPVNTITESYYINEKVALDDIVGGYRSLREYRQMKQQASFGLMDNPSDPLPYKQLKRAALIMYIKRKIKKTIGL